MSEDLQGMTPISKIDGMEKYQDYYVDVMGNVYSTKTKRLKLLKPAPHRKKNGYLFVVLTDVEGNKKNWRVHRLVAKAFLGPGAEGDEVNHKNRNPFDNRVSNLEWCSRGRNLHHNVVTNGTHLEQTVVEKAKKAHALLCKEHSDFPNIYSFINAVLEAQLDTILGEKSNA